MSCGPPSPRSTGGSGPAQPPPPMPRLELDDTGGDFLRDGAGNARGGIRTPHVDVPIATLSGLGQAGGSFCSLFGTTTPFTPDQMAERHGDHPAFVAEWAAATDAAVAAGVILPVDADRLKQVAAASDIGR